MSAPARESIQITVERYRDPKGTPTCCADMRTGDKCRFLKTRRWGTIYACGPLHTDLVESGEDYLRPISGCPVWEIL